MTRQPAPAPYSPPRRTSGRRPAASPDGGRVDVGGTMLRLRALHVMGHGCARIAEAAGTSRRLIQRVVRGETRTVAAALAAAVAEVYDHWWDKRAPERTHAERTAANAARGRARRAGWCAPAALDDDLLDQPGYQPPHRWRPATGTGTATRLPTPNTSGRNSMTTNPANGKPRGQPSPGGFR
jgi:hypothetical protein